MPKRDTIPSGPPPTIASARASLTVRAYCDKCRHYAALDLQALGAKYGDEMTLPALRSRLVCSSCGSRSVTLSCAPTSMEGLDPR